MPHLTLADVKCDFVSDSASDTTPPPSPSSFASSPLASPPAFHSPFLYRDHTAESTGPVTPHLCTDLASLQEAIEYLKGEPMLGIDIEHQPFGARKGEERPRSQAAETFQSEANAIAEKAIEDFRTANPDAKVERKTKFGYTSGIKTDAGYMRSSAYTKAALSVLQLASPSHIVIAHFALFPTTSAFADQDEFIPQNLRDIMADPNVLKIGVEVSGNGSDTHSLSRYFNMPSDGLLELRDLHNTICPEPETPDEAAPATTASDGEQPKPEPKPVRKPQLSLKKLAEIYLDRTLIGKGAGNTTTSEWQLPQPLSPEQLDYAANDAFVSVKIYDAMMKKRSTMHPIPAFPACRSAEAFDFEKDLATRVANLQLSGSKTSKRKLAKLGHGTLPPEKLVVQEGGSKSAVQSQKRRDGMDPRDAELADLLTTLRNECLKEQDVDLLDEKEARRKHHWVLEDKMIDRIVKTHPRPATVDALVDVIAPAKRQKFRGKFAARFLEVSLAQMEVEDVDGGAVQEIAAANEAEGKGEVV